ncbi:hypothetical protein [uncultured Nostoc sp.]|uniref:hypothetical protein n=1 Tax=uncultured Nostoc sp. TaxID=340711 RepID=UPI0035CC1FEA
MMIDSEQKISIRTALRDSKREGLINFVEEFITLLDQEGYSFQDLLEAIVGYCYRLPESMPDSVTDRLEDAASQLHLLTKNQGEN